MAPITSSVTEATLNTLRSYKKIAEESDRRFLLLKDSACLSFLIYVLDDENINVVENSIQILLLLTESLFHRRFVKEVHGLTKTISMLSRRDMPEYLRVSVDILTERLTLEAHGPFPGQEFKEKRDLGQQTCSNILLPTPNTENEKKPGLRFISGLGHKSKSLTFQLSGGGLTKVDTNSVASTYEEHNCFTYVDATLLECQSTMETELLKLRGIISIYFDLSLNRCIVRAKRDIKDEVVALAILHSGLFSVEQVVKTEFGDEVLRGWDLSADKENQVEVDGPDYLNESFGDSPNRGATDPGNMLARTDHHKERRDSGGGWWGNVASFLTSSFYW